MNDFDKIGILACGDRRRRAAAPTPISATVSPAIKGSVGVKPNKERKKKSTPEETPRKERKIGQSSVRFSILLSPATNLLKRPNPQKNTFIDE